MRFLSVPLTALLTMTPHLAECRGSGWRVSSPWLVAACGAHGAMELTGGGWWSGHPRLLVVGARRKLNTEMFIPTITTHQTHVQSASWGVGGHSMYNGQFLWPVYCIKVRLQHITISSQLHVLEAQQKRHEKSHKKGQVVRLLKFILDMCRYIYV